MMSMKSSSWGILIIVDLILPSQHKRLCSIFIDISLRKAHHSTRRNLSYWRDWFKSLIRLRWWPIVEDCTAVIIISVSSHFCVRGRRIANVNIRSHTLSHNNFFLGWVKHVLRIWIDILVQSLISISRSKTFSQRIKSLRLWRFSIHNKLLLLLLSQLWGSPELFIFPS